MADFARLLASWSLWTAAAGMTGVSTSADNGGDECRFTSDDQSFRLRRDGQWWVVDKIDDRGQRHDNLASFSTFTLAEKFLIWRWSSTARSAIGAASLGARLHALGMAPHVTAEPAALDGAVDLHSAEGSATVPRSIGAIFSHLMGRNLDEVEKMVTEGVIR